MTLQEEALSIYGKGPTEIEKLLGALAAFQLDLKDSLEETVKWANRWNQVENTRKNLLARIEKLNAEIEALKIRIKELTTAAEL